MLRLASGRRSLEGILKWVYMTQRHRSGHKRNTKPLTPKIPHRHGDSFLVKNRLKVGKSQNPRREPRRSILQVSPPKPPVIGHAEEIPYFQSEVTNWANNAATFQRLVSFGLPEDNSRAMLDHFARTVQSGGLSSPSDFEYYQLSRFSMPHSGSSIDIIYSTIFFWWASTRETRGFLEKVVGIRSETLDSIQKITQATDRSFPADEFPDARRNRRTIIMHVGPTNSGKTHHALRALASASTGVYAGPLRLLAHEIWERLNTGKILPLGVEEDEKSLSISHSSSGDPRFVRLCNLITGEEHRFMGEHVPLHSCTIEMLSYRNFYDVAVVDEIQMLADKERANAWVNAVLGINAKEVHLCGEETAIPIVQDLLKHTGDEVIVRRYERLSPLVVEEKSLDGDLSKVQKGDCIVTFCRKSIFQMKEVVERKTGMKCAVVYGRLPPEIRSLQAALFNDPNSGYDVLIGSDAIGMGLNLKIKRIIFDVISKWDGSTMTQLPVSAVKQIAGRAGRFLLHGSDGNAGGTVATLHAEDLPYVKRCVAQPYEPLPCAYIGHTNELFTAVAQVVPKEALMTTVLEAPSYAGRLPLVLRYNNNHHRVAACQYLDLSCNFSIAERLMLLNAPIPWRDPECAEVIKRMLRSHQDEMSVKVATMYPTRFYQVLLAEEKNKAKRKASQSQSLIRLESFHKIVVFYLWMHQRYPVVYFEYLTASALKSRIEKVLTWCLDNISAKIVKRGKDPHLTSLQLTRPGLSYMSMAELRKKALLGTG